MARDKEIYKGCTQHCGAKCYDAHNHGAKNFVARKALNVLLQWVICKRSYLGWATRRDGINLH